jgi:hypothetical protein
MVRPSRAGVEKPSWFVLGLQIVLVLVIVIETPLNLSALVGKKNEHEHDARPVRKLDLWSDRPSACWKGSSGVGAPIERICPVLGTGFPKVCEV